MPAGADFVEISQPGVDDSVARQDAAYTLSVRRPASGVAASYVIGSPSSATVRLLDNDRTDSPEVSVLSVEADQVTEGAPVRVTFVRSGNPAQQLTARFRLTGALRFLADQGSGILPDKISFKQDESTATLEISTDDDAVAEDSGDLTLTLQENDDYVIGRLASATVGIVDNDEQVRPTVVISAPAEPVTSTTTTATFTFSEDVTGFALGNIAVDGGTASDFATVSASVYTATITPDNPDSDVTIDVAADVAEDPAGNFNTAAAPVTIRFAIDAVAPTVVITAPATAGMAATATFTFSEDVTGFTLGDIAVDGGTASNLATISASVYTATISPDEPVSDVTIDVAADVAEDLTGNGNEAAAPVTIGFAIDDVAPTVVITAPAIASEPVTATFTFSEDVAGFTLADISVDGGTASEFAAISASVYTAIIAPDEPTSDVTIDVAANAAEDPSGNANEAAAPVTIGFAIDDVAPTVVITAPATASVPVTATFTFSEDVVGFTLADISVDGGTASEFAAISASVYTVTIAPDEPVSDITIDVAANAAEDPSGNANEAAASVTVGFAIDAVAPSVVIDAPAQSTSAQATVIFQFSEPVTDFTVGDISVEGGEALDFRTVSASAYTATITPVFASRVPTARVTVGVDGNVAQDLAGNGNTAAAPVTIRFRDDGAIRTRTRRVISNFLTRRADQIATAEPDLVRRLKSRDGTTGGQAVVGSLHNGDGQTKLSFATGLRQTLAAHAAEKRQATMSLLRRGDKAGAEEAPPARTPLPGLDLWVEGAWARATTEGVENDLGSLSVGVDYTFGSSLVVGLLGQFDWTDESDRQAQFDARGFGWMVGPYLVHRLHDNLIFDGRVAIGRSDNEVSPYATYTDSFEGERWLAKGQLTGDFRFGAINVAPHVGVIYFEERQKAFTDHNGVAIDSQTARLGRLTFGPQVSSRYVAANGTVITPSLGVRGIWDFTKTGLVDLETGARLGEQDLRGRVDLGLSVALPNGISVAGKGFYDGVGADDFESYGGNLAVKIPLQQ
ncbi:MAG: Ig-like domain-containing protein [Hyphomicrobiaceae bacterium]